MLRITEYIQKKHINKFNLYDRLVLDDIPCTFIGEIGGEQYVLSDYYKINGTWVDLDHAKNKKDIEQVTDGDNDEISLTYDYIKNVLTNKLIEQGWDLPNGVLLGKLKLDNLVKAHKRFDDISTNITLGQMWALDKIWCNDGYDHDTIYTISSDVFMPSDKLHKSSVASIRLMKRL